MPSPTNKISSKSTSRFKSCARLKNLNVHHFEVVEATGFSGMESKSSSTHHLHTKFHPNPPNGSKVIKVFLYTYLRSLNIRQFGMAEDTRLKVTSRSP
jgi:hypothetical protein